MRFFHVSFVAALLSLLAASGSVEVVQSVQVERKYESNVILAAITAPPTDIPTFIPTPSPSISAVPSISFKPTVKPSSAKPTAGKPTRAPTIGIYLENENVYITQMDQQAIVGSLTILLFIFMAMEILSPEILFMIALIIIMLCQILTMAETLSGKDFELTTYLHIYLDLSPSYRRLLQ